MRCFVCTFVPHNNADHSVVLSSAVPLQNEGHGIHAALEIEPNDSPSTARRVCDELVCVNVLSPSKTEREKNRERAREKERER